MSAIDNLEPQNVWKHFFKICSIPHPSKHESKIIEYIKNFADQKNLQATIDPVGNIIVSKPASPGKETHEGVILQGHVDMVPQKNETTKHDFLKDPIIPYIDGNWIKAKNTTLGADNGIGAAIMLAVLESRTISHGPLEALFTIDEETGMTGALGLQAGLLQGKNLINLDTEEEGQLYIGCAGGLDCSAEFSYTEEVNIHNSSTFTIALKDLKGGHSGIDIHLGRGNAIKLLNRILYDASNMFDLRISSFHGGSVRNAIPREAFAVVTVSDSHRDSFKSFVKKQEKSLNEELQGSETGIAVTLTEETNPDKVLSLQSQTSFLKAIYTCPNGVTRMSSRVQNVVETSNNLAIANYQNGNAQLHCLLRSSIGSAIQDLKNAIFCAFTLAGARVEFTGGYPGWEPNPDSQLLKTMINEYKSVTGNSPEVKVVHAGLECGIIGSKYPSLEMISCGPTIQYPHSPDERVEIASVERFWNYLIKVLDVL